jgi:hypothetical protein
MEPGAAAERRAVGAVGTRPASLARLLSAGLMRLRATAGIPTSQRTNLRRAVQPSVARRSGLRSRLAPLRRTERREASRASVESSGFTRRPSSKRPLPRPSWVYRGCGRVAMPKETLETAARSPGGPLVTSPCQHRSRSTGGRSPSGRPRCSRRRTRSWFRRRRSTDWPVHRRLPHCLRCCRCRTRACSRCPARTHPPQIRTQAGRLTSAPSMSHRGLHSSRRPRRS